jgi:hypothetical protein
MSFKSHVALVTKKSAFVAAAIALAAQFIITTPASAAITGGQPTASVSGTDVVVSITGMTGWTAGTSNWIILAKDSSNAVVAAKSVGNFAPQDGLSTFYIGSDLTYNTAYVFTACQGIMNFVTPSSSTCSGTAYTSATFTTPALGVPTISVSGSGSMATVTINSTSETSNGGYIFYSANDLTTALKTIPAPMLTNHAIMFISLSPLATGNAYIGKYCTQIMGMACMNGASYSSASSSFTVAAGTPPQQNQQQARVKSANNNATVKIAGTAVANNGTVELVGVPAHLDVQVTPEDNRCTVTTSVPATPVLGNNTVNVFVYAENGAVREFDITVHITAAVVTPPVVVPPTPKPSTDATAAITANGVSVTDGGVINLAAGTTSVAVAVTPTEAHATYTVSGATGLTTGNNTVTVTVTAQDGSKKTYSFTAAVAAPLSADATATITVAGINVNDGDHINLPVGTTQVAVAVTPTEPHATYSVAGATGLTAGTSVLTVTVTAQSGATKIYSYQLVVAADTSPVSITGSGVSALDRVKAALAAGRTAVITFTAKAATGAAAHLSVVSQIRSFKTAARAAGISGRISLSITDAGNSASGVVRVG